MNYYRRYVGDYLKKTIRLTMAGHGAYGLMLDYYYAEERPLPLDMEDVYAIARAASADDRRVVDKVLATYFTQQADGYHNERADHEIEVSQKARDHGGLGGRPKTGPQTGKVTGGETGHVTGRQTGKGGGQGHPPTTNHQPPTTNLQPPSKATTAAGAAPAGFDAVWEAYPKRAGNNPRKRAERCYHARLAEKHAHQEILDGVARYAKFCLATSKTGTELVLQCATFLGPDKGFLQSWAVTNGSGRWDANEKSILAKAKELGIGTMGVSWPQLKDLIRERLAR